MSMTRTNNTVNWFAPQDAQDEMIEARAPYAQPPGIVCDSKQADQWMSIPHLDQLRRRHLE